MFSLMVWMLAMENKLTTFTHNTKLRKNKRSKSSWETREISYKNGMQVNTVKGQLLNPYGNSQLHKRRMEKQVTTQ